MSDDQSAASVMEEIQKMRQDMIDLKTQVKTAEDRAENRLAKSENVPPTADFYPKLPPYLEIISQ